MIEKAIAEYSAEELVKFFRDKANDTIDTKEYMRYIATAFYLEAYTKLPFT